MDRSDPHRPCAADPNAASPEPAKSGAPAQAAPTAEHPPALTDAEFAAIERAHFEVLERETTQPARPHAVDARPMTEPSPRRHHDDATPPAPKPFEPAPFAVPSPVTHAAPSWPPEEPPTPTSASVEIEPEPAPVTAPPARIDDAPLPHAPQRDWRDLARRAAKVAFLVFAGWFIAVLVLIAIYRFVNPPFSMLMAQRFLSGTAIDKQWVPLERISPNLSRAVIVAEDGRFCSHWGVDLIEAANAIRRASNGYPRGASTITMQVAKNLFLLPVKSYLRKLIEIPLTFAIELAWPKRRILEVYLNIVEWGPGVFGAEAASRAHFGRAAAALSARQAAQLAAVLPNPIVRDAGAPGPRTARKASVVQARAAGAREASACVDRRR